MGSGQEAYAELHARSLRDPEGFWGEVAQALQWERLPDRILDSEAAPFYRWFVGGMINVAWNAVDRHVLNGRGDQAAIIYDSPLAGTKRTLTYADLLAQTSQLAGALHAAGVTIGDRVIIYMPMVPEALVAMLACARLGAIHSVVFGGFAAHELATRIDDARPACIIAASCGIEPGRLVPYKPLLDRAIDMAAHKPGRVIMLQRPQLPAELVTGRDIDWDTAMAKAAPHEAVPTGATDPLYILYTSGTTGAPKGVVRDHGGYAAALVWSMANLYGIKAGDVFWTASDIGWVVGHSYIVYGPLLAGATTVVFEGKPVGTPDAGAFWRVIEEHKVKALFTAPTAFRAIRKEDPAGDLIRQHDLTSFEALYLAGERCDPDTLHWAEQQLGVPVIDHWWQTETGWAICGNPRGLALLPVKAGSPSLPMPGYDVRVLDEAGQEAAPGQMGAIVIKLPLPPGCLQTLWQADDRYRRGYLERYPGWYLTGDAGYRDEDGYLYIMSRIDDVINVAGHRLSTGGIEEVLSAHPSVAECAVFGVADDLKGELPLGLVVLKAGTHGSPAEIARQLVTRVREQIGPVAAFRHVAVVSRLPKTRSGKILRGTMKKIADGQDWTMPPTIDDPAILDEIQASLRALGYADIPASGKS